MIVILGASGLVGTQCKKVFPEATGLDRRDIDVNDAVALKAKLLELRPEVIINCVAYNDVDGAELHRDLAFHINAELVQNLVMIANELKAVLIHFSTGYIFDGSKDKFAEQDTPGPLSVYAQSKAEGEKFVQQADKYYLVRTNVVFGPSGSSELSKPTFVDIMLKVSQDKPELTMVNDEVNSITYAPDLANNVKLLLDMHYPWGIYHIVNSGEGSWYDYALEIFKLKDRAIRLVPISAAQFPRAARRPRRAVLANTKLPALRSWQAALKEFLISK